MNKLEEVGLEKLRNELIEALKRCAPENEDRMQHEVIFLRTNIENSLYIVDAIFENNDKDDY